MTEKKEPMTQVTLPDGRAMDAADYAARIELLSKPFAVEEIEKLPKQLYKDDKDKGKCEPRSKYSADGYYCGGYHARSLHLDYIGHAGITDRLNQVDPMWRWEPLATTEHGTPLFTDGGMWGKLTVLGVTRIGFGDPGRNSGPNAIKETIGDFIRNAAMRFGVATYLWSKSEAAAAKKIAEDDHVPQEQRQEQPAPTGQDWEALYNQALGNRQALEALRNQGKQAGAPAAMFTAIENELASMPVEGNVVTNG